MKTGKTTKYFKYAIGEIVLVVIGILIALWINNKNEALKNEEKIEALFRDIQKDLSEDVLNSHNVFDSYIRKDSLKKRFLKNELESSFGFIYRYAYLPIQSDGYSNLKQNANNVPKKFLPILKELNTLYGPLQENIEVYNKRIQNTVYNSIDYLAKNKDWFMDWDQSIDNPEITEYYKNDIHYRNEVGLYMNDLKNLFLDTNEFRVGAIEIYKEIENLLGNTNAIPKHMTYQLEDINELKALEGTYEFVESTLGEVDNSDLIIKVEDNNRLVADLKGTTNPRLRILDWYKDNIFFNGRNIITFQKSNGEVTLIRNSYNGTVVLKKVNND